ncbi:MAG: phage baseplate assembly protein V [Candidatus Methanoperedens sp.]|nr:phage baseplate assembly protein V [Candidatus Methanoperedens sp.]
MSITEILEQSRRPDSRINGVVVGVVTDNKDPDKLGRVKVKIPRLSAEDESNWARVISFMGGKLMGGFFLPEVNDEVLVAFEYGDINIPYVIGSLWNGKDTPPLTNDDGKNNFRIIKSRSGHVIRLDDTDGQEKIEIVDKSENNKIIIDTKEKKISIISDKDIEISAPNGKVTIKANDFEVKSQASAKIEASASMDLKASGTTTIKGATVNIN